MSRRIYIEEVKAINDALLRACAVAGLYLQAFSILEARLDGLLQQALRVDYLQALVVARNMPFMEKVRSVRSLLPVTVYGELAKKIDNRLKRFSALAEQRNIIAHSIFGPSDTGGFEVLVVKASGSLKLPVFNWSIDEMFDLIEGLEDEENALRGLADEFKTFTVIMDSGYLNSDVLPDGRTPLQGLLGIKPDTD